MKKLLVCVIITLLAKPLISQDLIDPAAYQQAINRLGQIAWVGRGRVAASDVYWTTIFAFKSPGCVNPITTVATDPTDNWTKTFANYDANPPKFGGPFKDTVAVTIIGFGPNASLSSISILVDGVVMGTQAFSPTVETGTAVINLDTTMLTNAYHALCAKATNISGDGATYNGYLFKVNQTTGQSQSWTPQPTGTKAGATLVSMEQK